VIVEGRSARALIHAASFACSMVAATALAQFSPAAASQPDTAGHYRIVRWTTAEGLPQNTINDIVLLPNGELWLATFGGLARFDGHRFHVVDIATDEGLPANRVISMAPAASDSFWFLTQQGHLGRVERGRAVTLVQPASPSIDALGLFGGSGGRLYCKLVDGSIWHSSGAHAWRLVLGSSNSGGMLHAFATTDAGEVWAGWGTQLVQLRDGAALQSAKVPSLDPDVFPRAGGGLWLGLRDGLAHFEGGKVTRIDVRPAIEGQVTVVEPGGAGALWVTAQGDVSRLEPQADGSWQRTQVSLGLPAGISVRSMKADGAGSLWVGTNGYGLLRVTRSAVRRFGPLPRLGEVTALAPEGSGGAFVASGCRGLFHLDANGNSRPVSLRDPRATGDGADAGCGISLAAAPDGGVWARFGPGLFRLRRQGQQVQRIREDLPDEEGPLVATKDGSVWIVSRRGVVHLLSPAGNVVRRLDLSPPLISASMAPDGSLWVGGDGRVFRVDGEAVQGFGPEAHVPRGLVRDIAALADGTAWIGTYGGGVGRLRGGKVGRVTAASGLPDNSISRILDDGRGRIWISTNRGLAVIGHSDLEAAADGRLRTLAPVVLGPERGVAEGNFGSPAGFADADGRLWFGTIEGVVVVDAAAFPFNQAPPVVRVEGVSADGVELPLAGVVRVPPLATRIHVTFSMFEPRYPERVRFRFRVEDTNTGWVDSGAQPSLDWTAPGPGRHRLLIEARNEDGVWSANPAVVVLEVLPAWWQTTPFRSAVVLGAIVAAFSAFRLRVRAIERRHAERLRALEEQRQAEERLASLRAQLEHVSRVALAGELAASLAHEVSQPLGAIVNNAEAGKRHLTQYLERPDQLGAIFGDIVADGMRASEVVRGLRGFLRPRASELEAVDLSAVVREMLPLLRRELRDNRVDLQLDLADGLPPVEGLRVQLGQVVVNLALNACEALADVAGARRMVVATAPRDGRVELVVRDNGPGLAEAVAARIFEPFVTTKPDGLGMGLAICRAIAEAHGGHLNAEGVEGGGLQVTLSLPAAAHLVNEP